MGFSLVLFLIAIFAKFTNAEVYVYCKTTFGNVILSEFSSYEMNLGPLVPARGLEGHIYHMNKSIDGCEPFSHQVHSNSFILLRKTTNCSLKTQVLNSQRASYLAVLFYSSRSDDSQLWEKDKNATSIYIPSILISETAAKFLNNMDSSNTKCPNIFVLIKNPFFNFDFRMIFVILFLFGVLSIVSLVLYVMNAYRAWRRERSLRMPLSAATKLPAKVFCEENVNAICVICTELLQQGDQIRVLPCNHFYHQLCVDEWLINYRRTCPICRRKIFADGETQYSDSDSDDDSYAPMTDRTPLVRSELTHVTNSSTFTALRRPPIFTRNRVAASSNNDDDSDHDHEHNDEEYVNSRTNSSTSYSIGQIRNILARFSRRQDRGWNEVLDDENTANDQVRTSEALVNQSAIPEDGFHSCINVLPSSSI